VTSRHDQCHLGNAMTNVASEVPSPARLSSDMTLRPILTWQCHRQQDSASPSPAGLDSNVTPQPTLT
jgi:hypothetical protein